MVIHHKKRELTYKCVFGDKSNIYLVKLNWKKKSCYRNKNKNDSHELPMIMINNGSNVYTIGSLI